MKKISIKLFLFSITVLIYSCDGKPTKNDLDSNTEKVEIRKEASHDEHELKLDNGKLWAANPETTTGVNNMIELVNSFSDKDNVEAYHTLTEEVTAEFSMIFQKCTMKGEAHNQLHNFLIPIKNLFDSLNSSELNTCAESYDQLEKHLAVYSDYFE